MNTLRSLLAMLWHERPLRPWLLAAVLVATGAALVPAIPPLLMKRAIDEGILQKDPGKLFELVVVYLLVVTGEALLALTAQLLVARFGQRAIAAIRRRAFMHLNTLDLMFFEQEPRGKTVTRVTNDVESLAELFTSGAFTIFADILLASVIVLSMLRLNVTLTLAAFVTLPPMLFVAEYFRRQARDAFRHIRSAVSALNAFVSEHLFGHSVVVAFGQQARVQHRFVAVSTAVQNANKRAIWVDSSLFAVVEALSSMSIAALIGFGAASMSEGAVELGVLVAFVQYSQRFFIPVRDLSSKFAIVQSGLTAVERLMDLFALRPSLQPPAQPQALHSVTPIRFASVSFSYGGSDGSARRVLNNVSFGIETGEKIAIVGATGSGKTTLVKLALRLVDVTEGAVVVGQGQTDIKQVDLVSLRRRIALVPQDPVLFEGSLRENLSGFNQAVSDQELLRVCDLLGLGALVSRLGGLDGAIAERGGNLSSGEAQLIAFARAVTSSPDLLILDEATSAIDPANEALVQQGLLSVLTGRAALVIAHRLSTLRMCDRIVFIEGGQIKESGTHDELMRRGGAYAALYELQFADVA